jgi:Cysteine-rich secretory protein family
MQVKLVYLCLVLVMVVASPVARAQEVDAAAARQIFELLNRERTSRGLQTLTWDDRLAQAAVEHSRLLARNQALSHQFAGELPLRERFAQYSIRLDSAGENVAYDSTIEGAHQGFMHSPPHRENILSPKYDAAGVGVVHSGNLYYVTQDFAHLVANFSTNSAEDRIAAAVQQMRTSGRQPPLQRVSMPVLRKMACDMAKDDRVEPERARTVEGARYFVAYTMTRPEDLPPTVTKLRSVRDVDRFATGACFQSTPTYPNGVYWVMMVFFQPKGSVSP